MYYTSGKNLTIREARNKGILDTNLTTYTDLKTNTIYSIQEAIDNHLLVASLDTSTNDTRSSSGNTYRPILLVNNLYCVVVMILRVND